MASTMILLAGLDPGSIVGLLSAGFAGLALFLALRHPAGQLRRMTRRPSRFAALTTPLARIVRGRPDAPPLVRRAVLSTACAFGLRLAAIAAGRLAWDRHVVERPSGLCRRHSRARLA